MISRVSPPSRGSKVEGDPKGALATKAVRAPKAAKGSFKGSSKGHSQGKQQEEKPEGRPWRDWKKDKWSGR